MKFTLTNLTFWEQGPYVQILLLQRLIINNPYKTSIYKDYFNFAENVVEKL